MPRPKGSKNKKKLLAGANIEELIAQRNEAKAALEAERDEQAAVVAEETAKLKSIKAEIKRLDKELVVLDEQKVAAEAAAAAEAAKEAVQSKIAELMAEGKSLEDIMNMLG
jgi:peptidoglycan hydrolase CwlO-like protein